MLELHYNSGQFLTYLAVLEWKYDSTFQMFLDMGHFYREHGYLDCSHSRVRRTEIVQEFAEIVDPERRDIYREALDFDLYKIENPKAVRSGLRMCSRTNGRPENICGNMVWRKILPF